MEAEATSAPTATEPVATEKMEVDSQQDDGATKQKKVTFSWGSLVSLNQEYPHQELSNESYLLGRHKECDIKFTSESISNRHCRIFKVEDSDHPEPVIFIEDLSSNGTFVNGKKIGKGKKLVLSHKDEIQLTIKKDPENPLADKYFVFQLPHQKGKEKEKETQRNGKERNIFDHYDIQKDLGSGNFADVKLGVDRETGEKFAIKVIDKTKNMTNPKFFQALQREVGIMMEVQHPNLVGIVDYYDEDNTLYLVLEYMQGGDLFDRLVEKKKFSEKEAKVIFMQLLLGVKYLHDMGIAHRDLKPENVLLVDHSDDHPVKITDFGLARIVNEGSFMKTVCGTPFYLAPDVQHYEGANGYNNAVDLWSLGVILYILLCGYPPFSDERKDHPLNVQVARALYSFHSPYWDPISENAKSMIRGLLVVDPNVRLTVEQALEHPWVKVYPPVLKEVHQRLSKRMSSNLAPLETAPAPIAKRTDTVLPVEISSPIEVRKRGRPRKADTHGKKPKLSTESTLDATGVPLTGKGSGRRGGPGRGKKGPKTLQAETEKGAGKEAENGADDDGDEGQSVKVPPRGRQGTKMVKPVLETPEKERRSTRNKKAE